MHTQRSAHAWRWISFLMLFTWMLSPGIGFSARAAPIERAGRGQDIALSDDHLITNINMGPDTPNALANGEYVNLSFNFTTIEPSGVRLFVLPYTNGSPSPNYAVNPSPLYPTGSGQGTGFFTITSGNVTVDQVRLRMTDANQTVIHFETFIPVHYYFESGAHAVTGITFAPDTPNVLAFDQDVTFRFNYKTDNKDGVRIWMRPFTNGQLTPNYAAHGSGIYPAGTGSGSGFFTITSGPVVVDHVRIQMWDPNETVLLFETFLPVYYRFKDLTNIVTHINIMPDTPNVFKYNEDVNFTFNYTTNNLEGVRIWVRPFSGPSLSPSYAAHGSIVHPTGSGSATGSFTLTAGPVLVDKVRVQMWNPDQTTLLFEAFLPVHLSWEGSGPPPGPDMGLDAIEVTQAIQDLNNSVDLVAGKRTYVRVHASSPVNVADVYATLKGSRGGVTLYPTLTPGNPGGDITLLTSPDRGQINDSFWFELPNSWTAAGDLTLTARLDPNNVKNDLVLGDNTRTLTVNFKSTPPLRLRIVNVQYTSGGNTYLAGNSHLAALESWLRRAYPINSLQVNRQTFVYPTNGLPNVDTLHGWLALAKLLRILFSGEDGRVVYYGVVDDGGGFMRGKAADIPSTIAAGPSGTDTWGWDFDGSYNDWYGGHEIAHTRGRYHAEFCGAGGGIAFPYPNGRISPDLSGNDAIYGFDITTRAIYGPNWKDVMTYCSNQWVSDFTYEGIRNYLVGVGLQPEAPAAVTASQFLIVVGLADLESNTGSLQSVYLINQEDTLPLPDPGDWSIALVDAANADLAVYPFAPDALTDSEESPGTPAVIAEVVPWVAGTSRVEVRYLEQVVAERSASANAPTVNITAPTAGSNLPEGPFLVTWEGADLDGDSLHYSLLYSADGAATWETLATDLSASELELNTDQLPGGSVQVRVVASDGLLTGQADSGSFNVPLHAPAVEITLPAADEVFFPTQQVNFQGSAYDLEDGAPDEAAYAWASSLDGPLGTGSNLSTSELTTGAHVITLTVTDSDGMSGQATHAITISDAEAPEALTLEAAPLGFGVVAGFGDPAAPYTLTLRSSGEGELDWTATESADWLTLDPITGTTPSELVATIDPGQLPVGIFTGVVTLTTDQPDSPPQEIPITLQVLGSRLHLPLVNRGGITAR